MKRLFAIFTLAFVVMGTKGYVEVGTTEQDSTWQSLAAPSPLTAEEEALPIVEELARRYNPAMAFVNEDIWPTPVSYIWHDGSHLIARVLNRAGRVVSEHIALANDRLSSKAWADLPHEDEAGNSVEYWVAAPGDDRLVGGLSGWIHRWRDIMGDASVYEQDITLAEYPPTQYAHLYWHNRERGLLGIQYWFYYPFNEWINHHEGDWEHINVILQGPTALTPDAEFEVVGHQFFFHQWVYEPSEVIRLASESDPRNDHVMVYTGGHGRFLGWKGSYSGGSYPLPAVYRGAGGGVGLFRPTEDTSQTKRFIAASDFDVVVLPEPERLDADAHPELSWLRLPFFAGQPSLFRNPFLVNLVDSDAPPPQPGVRDDWNAMEAPSHWPYEDAIRRKPIELPDGWQRIDSNALKSPDALVARQYPPEERR